MCCLLLPTDWVVTLDILDEAIMFPSSIVVKVVVVVVVVVVVAVVGISVVVVVLTFVLPFVKLRTFLMIKSTRFVGFLAIVVVVFGF